MKRACLILGLILLSIAVGYVHAAIIADSVTEFSGVQGQNSWYYGYYDKTSDSDGTYNPNSDFQLMTEFHNIITYFGSWIWSVDWANWGPGGYWTSLGELGGHPNGTNQNWGRLPNVQWPIRRWISETAGAITISGTFKGLDCGNITGYIIVDGAEVWSQNISCTAGVNYTVDTAVQVGSKVDFAITPSQNDNDVNDSTEFTAIINAENASQLEPGNNVQVTVPVSLPSGGTGTVTVTFDQVDTGGTLSITATDTPLGGGTPTGFRFLGTYYDVTYSGSFSGYIYVSLPYDDSGIPAGRENNLRLFHWEGRWIDVTYGLDTVNNRITGRVTSLSPFGMGYPLGYTTGANENMIAVIALLTIMSGLFLLRKQRKMS